MRFPDPLHLRVFSLRRLVVHLCIVWLVASTGVAAQTGATLQGTVKDEQGFVLPGVSVTLTNVETGVSRTVVTDDRGWYRGAALPPGIYDMKAELSGFGSAQRSKVAISIGQELTINLTLTVATLNESVLVTAAAPLVETTSNTLGTTISRDQLDSLPVPGRSFAALAQTAPGVTGVGGGGVNSGGQLSRNNSYRIDGVSNDNNVLASPRGGLSLEAVREYVVVANQFSAEYGDASGAVVSVVTRSGTNELQGRAFLFHRGENLDAQDPFSKAQGSGKAPISQQRFGGFVGGPVVKDRMHFFGAYEGLRQNQTSVITSPLVPVDEREVPDKLRGKQPFFRFDSRLSSSQSVFVRYRLDSQQETGAGIGGLNTRERGSDTIERNQDVVASHTAVFTSKILNEVRVQFGRHFADNFVYMPIDSPTINRPSGNFGKPSNLPQGRTEDRLELMDNFSYSVSSHDMKFGIDYNRIRATSYFNNNTGGTFTFATDRAFDPADLLTYPIQFTQNIGDPNLFRPNDEFGVFAQDSWRLRSNFTLNLGVRYDHEDAFKKAVGISDNAMNIAPRLGFAWDPFNDQKTVVRGGLGRYYSKVFLNITGNIMLASHFVGVTIANPGYPDPYSRGSVAASVPSTTVAPDEVFTPVTNQFSLGVKRELGRGFALSADVVKSRGENLYNAPDINAPDPVTGRRPNPAFQRITQYQASGNSWYNGLLLGIEKRSGRGPQIGISYTLSKQIRDVEDFGFTAQDNYNRAAEKGPANNDRRHQLVANVVWPLPWSVQVGAFMQARSGLPWTVTTGIDNNRDANINDRPDLVVAGGNPLDKSTYSSAFTGRVGNLGRNTNRGPDYFEIHLRGSKFINLKQAHLDRLELFAEALNITNRDNYGVPVGNLRSSSFGTSTALATGATPRQVELGFRLNF